MKSYLIVILQVCVSKPNQYKLWCHTIYVWCMFVGHIEICPLVPPCCPYIVSLCKCLSDIDIYFQTQLHPTIYTYITSLSVCLGQTEIGRCLWAIQKYVSRPCLDNLMQWTIFLLLKTIMWSTRKWPTATIESQNMPAGPRYELVSDLALQSGENDWIQVFYHI